MLNQLDISLYEILDSVIDKSLTMNCYLNNPNNGDLWDSSVKMFIREQWDYIYTRGAFGEEQVQTKDFFRTTWNTLGHYPSSNEILRYCQNSKHYIGINLADKKWYLPLACTCHWLWFLLDLKTPLQFQSDTQKKGLIEFLNNIW